MFALHRRPQEERFQRLGGQDGSASPAPAAGTHATCVRWLQLEGTRERSGVQGMLKVQDSCGAVMSLRLITAVKNVNLSAGLSTT